MFQPGNFIWSSYIPYTSRNNETIGVDIDNFGRRSLLQFPITIESPEIVEPTHFQFGPVDVDMITESHREITQMEEMEDEEEISGVERREGITYPERRLFSTPCGQTYWVDDDLHLYTNERVDIPIGYWCNRDQCVYLDVGSGETTDDDDDYHTPPPGPPMYEESVSLLGSQERMDTNTDNEHEGMIIGASQ